ncbi:MAG: glycosyltransferase [Candidatus Omnitrophota bacterium]|nr:glycosyltransferase [Candidatus Omnitrophota bacterium]
MKRINKRILWLVTGRFNVYLNDGATASMMALFNELQKKGAECLVENLADRNIKKSEWLRTIKKRAWGKKIQSSSDIINFRLRNIAVNLHLTKYDITKLYRQKNKGVFKKLILDIAKLIEKNKPDIIFTSQEDIFSLTAASRAGIQHFHVFTSPTFKYGITFSLYKKEFKNAMLNTRIITRDIFKKDIKRYWKKKAFILPPIIDPELYRVKNKNPEYITFINYGYDKGAMIFINIARRLPDKRFLIIQSKNIFRSEPWLKNVTVMKTQLDMKKVYAVTKILLVPSLWEEAGPRVVFEALLNGIPVIATNQEAHNLLSQASFLVDINKAAKKKSDYYYNPMYHIKTYLEFVKIINDLDNNAKLYQRTCRDAVRKSRKIINYQEEAIEKFIDYIKN